jgi:hypothetical protein
MVFTGHLLTYRKLYADLGGRGNDRTAGLSRGVHSLAGRRLVGVDM